MQRTSIKITSEKLDLNACYAFVEDDSCGGISVFVGTVRNDTEGKEVKKLDFSTYKPMALKEMQKIADLALEKFDVKKSSCSSCRRRITNKRYSGNYCGIVKA